MNNYDAQAFKQSIRSLFIFNSIFWIVIYVALLFAFSDDNNPKKIDFIYTGSFLFTVIIPVLLNLYFIIPQFLKKEKYALYLVFLISTILLFTQLNIWFFNYFIDYVFPDYYFISYHSRTKLTTIFSIFLVGTTFIKLSIDWIYFNKQENKELKIKNQEIQTQLAALRSQINPHFLFNSLNVIYSLAIEKKEETKVAIIQLSEILRYVIYDSTTKQVSLKDEINLLKNYTEFQKLRHHKTDKIDFNYSITNDNYLIYPMLLLPLIENSFKYGIKGQNSGNFISVNLIQNASEFFFKIENNYSEDTIDDTKEYSGIGIENIKKNLEIVYPNKYEFNILKTEDIFTVILKLY